MSYSTYEHPATSLAKFIASHSEEYHRMANAPCGVTGSDKRTMIDIETRELHKNHLNGATISDCARNAGITNGAMSRRFQRRGLMIVYHAGGKQK